MPPNDRHGKTAQDYCAALTAELDAVPECHRRKLQHSPQLFACLLESVAPRCFSWSWLHLGHNAEHAIYVVKTQTPLSPPASLASPPVYGQSIAPSQTLMLPQRITSPIKKICSDAMGLHPKG